MFNDKDLTSTETDRLKVWPIETDQDAFIDVMTFSDPESDHHTELDDDENPEALFPVISVMRFGSGRNQVTNPPKNILMRFVTTMWHLLRVVVIDLESRRRASDFRDTECAWDTVARRRSD